MAVISERWSVIGDRKKRACEGRGRVYCTIATSESVPKAGLPPSGLVVPLFQGQRWILTSAPAWMASHSSRRRCSWNFSPGEAFEDGRAQFAGMAGPYAARRFVPIPGWSVLRPAGPGGQCAACLFARAAAGAGAVVPAVLEPRLDLAPPEEDPPAHLSGRHGLFLLPAVRIHRAYGHAEEGGYLGSAHYFVALGGARRYFKICCCHARVRVVVIRRPVCVPRPRRFVASDFCQDPATVSWQIPTRKTSVHSSALDVILGVTPFVRAASEGGSDANQRRLMRGTAAPCRR